MININKTQIDIGQILLEIATFIIGNSIVIFFSIIAISFESIGILLALYLYVVIYFISFFLLLIGIREHKIKLKNIMHIVISILPLASILMYILFLYIN